MPLCRPSSLTVLVLLGLALLAMVHARAEDTEEVGTEKSRPSPQLFLKAVAEQRDSQDRRLRPWKDGVAEEERLLLRAKSGAINASIATDVSRPSATRTQFVFRTKNVKEEFIARASQDLARHKELFAGFQSAKPPPPPYLKLPLSVGQLGVLEQTVGPTAVALQVVDENSMLANVSFGSRKGSSGARSLVVMHGLATKEIIDTNAFEPPVNQIFWISGTIRRNAAVGSDTLMVLEAMSEVEWIAFAAKAKD